MPALALRIDTQAELLPWRAGTSQRMPNDVSYGLAFRAGTLFPCVLLPRSYMNRYDREEKYSEGRVVADSVSQIVATVLREAAS